MHAVERAIAAIAGDRDNIVSRRQLLAAGVGRGTIAHRVRARSLHRLHSGVYLVGHAPPTPIGRARAAALACGEDAVVSHRSAAVVWGLMPADAARHPEVTVIGRNPHPRPGITIHRTTDLPKTELRHIRHLPITSSARTICDIAATEPHGDVEDALQEARVRRLVTDQELRGVIDRAPTRRGSAFIRRLVADEGGNGYTRSKAERIMRSLTRDANLPHPQASVRMNGYLLDFLWRDQRLVVEVDGYGTHGDRASFERDRERDQVLVAAGFRVIRVTWRQLTREPYAVIARLAQALAAA